MASGFASSVAGAVLAPFSRYAVDKLVKGLAHHLSKDSSSSSSHGDKNELHALMKELQDVSHKTKATLRVGKLLHKQDESMVYFYKQLKDALYEAEDLADDFEYLKLEEQVEKMNSHHEEAATALSHQSKAKKPRILPTKPLELQDDNMITHIREVIGKLNRINDDLSYVISMAKVSMELGKKGDNNLEVVLRHSNQNPRMTTSSVDTSKIFGRDREREMLTKLIKEPSASVDCNVNVIPIVGMGGIGKTTLTQCVFNDEDVANCFDEKMWICVSDVFNKLKIFQDMVSSLTAYKSQKFTHDGTLNLLECELRRNLQGKRLLLVLDDVWSSEWQKFLIPLESSQMRFAKIVITTRESKVLRKRDETNQIVLQGLEDHEYWEFFVSCAFGGAEANEHPILQNIGEQIVKKLKGSPLAAKTVGRLLERNMSHEHWMNVLKSNLWELETSADDIMPALALSYNHLPEHLQRCFVFCSAFVKDYKFRAVDLIEMWIAQGYVIESETSSQTLEEVGHAYFAELLSRSFLEKVDSLTYTIHDLFHDLAQSVCLGECLVYQGQAIKEKSTNVRHLCLQSPVDLRSVCNVESLRTLVVLRGELRQDEYEALRSIRVLILRDFGSQNCPCSIGHLRHLRYLDMVENGTPKPKLLDESLCRLYHLRVLPDVVDACSQNLHNLVNLRFLDADTNRAYTENMEYKWPVFCLTRKKRMYGLSELRNMQELRGLLLVNNLEKIGNGEEAVEANIKEKSHLESLALIWEDSGECCSSVAVTEVLEALQPNPNLKHLHIKGYKGSTCPSWFSPSALQNLQFLELRCFENQLNLQSIGQIAFLSYLYLFTVDVKIDVSDESTILFPALEELEILGASVCFEGVPLPASSQRRNIFPRLSVLECVDCASAVSGFPWHLFSNIQALTVSCSQGVYDEFSRCLISLKKLTITGGTMTSFVGKTDTLKGLSKLSFLFCQEFTFIGGLHFMFSLRSVKISDCPKFTTWLSEAVEYGVLLQNLYCIYIDDCARLESLPIWLPQLPSLKKLSISFCPLIKSFPDGGLPSSLESLHIEFCNQGFMEQLKKEGSPEWHMIQRIPDRDIF